MPCYHPRPMWRSEKLLNVKTGKPKNVFREPKLWYASKRHVAHYKPEKIEVPGCHSELGEMCVGCQETYSRAWAIRCWHESLLHDDNCFITLTYDQDHCPDQLVHKDFQDFMKRFRHLSATPIQYYMCGEYGEKNFRPHFHALIFGYQFLDKRFFKEQNGNKQYVSESLEKLWDKGFSAIGELTFASAAYVARYVQKKKYGQKCDKHYDGKKKEYVTMSLKRPIGKEFYKKFKNTMYIDDHVTVPGGYKFAIPKYYDRVFKEENPDEMEVIKKQRIELAKQDPDNKPDRLKVRETVKKAQFKQLKRSLT